VIPSWARRFRPNPLAARVDVEAASAKEADQRDGPMTDAGERVLPPDLDSLRK
jgi:hypothetical protein